MGTSRETKKRIQYKDDNKKKKGKTALIVIGSLVLLGGIACAIALPLTYCCNCTSYTIKTNGDEKYFNIDDKKTLTGWKDGVQMGERDLAFFSHHYKELIIPSRIYSIGDRAFFGSASFRDTTKPIQITFNLSEKFTTIGQQAFSGCAGITSLDFSKSDDLAINFIGSYAFNGCTLSTIKSGGNIQPLNTTGWGNVHVYGLANIYSTPDYTSRCLYADGCGCLAYGTFAPTESKTSIFSGAFYGCGGITNVDFSQNKAAITTIGQYAFWDCALKNIKEGNGIEKCELPSWGDMHVFAVKDSYTPNYTTNALVNENCGCLAYGSFTPTNPSTTTIGSQAFYGCAGITAIDLTQMPLLNDQSINAIGAGAFQNCAGIQSYKFADNQVINSNFTIGDFAFYGCNTSGKVIINNDISKANNLLENKMVPASGSPTWMRSSQDFWEAKN